MTSGGAVGSFWEHLDELRSTIVKVIAAVVIVALIAFGFKELLFDTVLAAQSSDFITYRILNSISIKLGGAEMENFSVPLINTELAQQFIIHIKMSIYIGFLLVLPYVLYLIFKFVSPALYQTERKYTVRIVSSGYVMFMMGVALSYFVVFPLTFRFLGTYQVTPEVENQILLSSYIGTLLMLNLWMGIVFEIPILCWLLAKMGIVSAKFLRKYRRHAVVILLVIAALITPTADVFTLILVAMPMYLLYELSILLVALTVKQKTELTLE